jgi:flagellar hook-length control protein FliK
MEFLSQQTSRADSGASSSNQTRSGQKSHSSHFDKIFERELHRHDQKMLRRANNEGRTEDTSQYNGFKSLETADTVKTPTVEDYKEETGENVAAGVMGNGQVDSVFILEGDKESVATPQVSTQAVEPPDTTQIINTETVSVDNVENTELKQFILNEQAAQTDTQQVVNTQTTVGTANTADNTTAANNGTTIEVQEHAAGEVTARMPEIRSEDSQDNQNAGNNYTAAGNLSPLENENDKPVETGQNEKTYSNTVNTVKEALENKSEDNQELNLNEIPPPLSEGIKPEQFKAAQQMSQAALSEPVKVENLFEEMISRVEMMHNDTKSAMTIQLNPEFLGKVALEVSIDAAGLHVKINAEDSSVKGMLDGQMTALIESLESKGIAVAEVDVVYSAINHGMLGESQHGEQQQSSGQHKPKARETNQKDGIAYYAALPDLMDYYLDTGISSVEYRA